MFWLQNIKPQFRLLTHINEGKLKILDRNQKYEDIICFYCIFRAFGSFYYDVVMIPNVHVCLGCTKTRSPEFGMVLHWRPPDVHIFHTDPSLVKTSLSKFQ